MTRPSLWLMPRLPSIGEKTYSHCQQAWREISEIGWSASQMISLSSICHAD
jgi:hypothetical protein